MRLTTERHDRDSAGKTYVYAVASRRAGGVSVGINLNPNDACNWRCVYCQVPGLVYGKAPPIDLLRLEDELDEVLRDALSPAWLEANAPAGFRRLADVAFSGNGEPTLSPQLAGAVAAVGRVLERHGLKGRVPLVLITNGSLLHRPDVQAGLRALAACGGEAWFKLDSATQEGMARVNSWKGSIDRQLENLRLCARILPTWIQAIAFEWSGRPPSPEEQAAWIETVGRLAAEGVPLKGVRLYGLARPSHQPEARELRPLAPEWLEGFAARIRAVGLPVQVSP